MQINEKQCVKQHFRASCFRELRESYMRFITIKESVVSVQGT